MLQNPGAADPSNSRAIIEVAILSAASHFPDRGRGRPGLDDHDPPASVLRREIGRQPYRSRPFDRHLRGVPVDLRAVVGAPIRPHGPQAVTVGEPSWNI